MIRKFDHPQDMAGPSTTVAGPSSQPTTVFRDGIGKYIPKVSSAGVKRSNPDATTETIAIKKVKNQLSDFSTW